MSAHNTDGHLPVSPRPNLTVVPHAEEGVPAARLRRNLNRMMRGRRVSRRHTLRVLVIEHVLIGRQRDASEESNGRAQAYGTARLRDPRDMAKAGLPEP